MTTQNKLICTAALSLMALVASHTTAQVQKVEELTYPSLPEFRVPTPVRVELPNGMVVMLLEDHELPLINATALVRTGSRHEPAEKVGLAALAGNVLRSGGTEAMSADELDLFLESKAASIESSIGVDMGRVRMSCLSADFADVLEVFADVLRRPAFDEKRLEVARTQVNAGIARQNDDPTEIMFREFAEIVYGSESPYARSETYESVASVVRQDLVDWHGLYFYPNRTILGLVGDFDTDQVVDLLREVFGDWESGPEITPVAAEYRQDPSAGVFYVAKDDMTQSNLAIGHMGIRKDNPDYYAVEVLNHVFSGSFSSRLFSNVRSAKGLAYAVSGGIGANWDYPGLFRMWMTTKTETTGAGIDALLEEAANLTAQPPSDEEIAKAKQSILNSFVFNSDSTRKILGQQLSFEYHGYPLDWLERYRLGIEAVTADAVRAAAANHIHRDRFSILVVGPSEGRDKPLSEYGSVTEVDISIPEATVPGVTATVEGQERGNELIRLAVEAMGGEERLDSIRSLSLDGLTVASTPQGDLEIRGRMFVVFPNRIRQEMTLPIGTMVIVISPEDSFMMTPQGTVPLPASQRAEMEKAMAFTQFNLLRARSNDDFSAIAVGPGDVNGQAVERVVVEQSVGTVTLGIDPATGRILSLVRKGPGMRGSIGDVREVYSDFRETGGLVFPYLTVGTFNDEPATESRLDEVVVDGEIESSLFGRPAA